MMVLVLFHFSQDQNGIVHKSLSLQLHLIFYDQDMTYMVYHSIGS